MSHGPPPPALVPLPDGRKLAYSLSKRNTVSSSGVVLLANSLCSPFTSWDHVVPVLEQHGYQVLRYDQPGHRDSTAPSDPSGTTFQSLADDVVYLLSHLNITQLYAWIGVSMGAATGVTFAVTNPGVVRNLVVCDTMTCSPVVAGIEDVFTPRLQVARSQGNIDSIVEQSLARWFSSAWRDRNSGETDRMRQLMRRTSVDGFAACISPLISPTFDLRQLAPKVCSAVENVLLVVGADDANLPETMKELKDQIQINLDQSRKPDMKVEFAVIKDAGHVSYIDGFEQFCSVVTTFLKS